MTRLGVLADVHGNLPAVEAAIAAVGDVDGWVCAGDVVGYGPFPDECVARVEELGAWCVAGNHDLIAIGRLDDGRCGPLARTTLQWTAGHLGDEARTYLAALPAGARPADGVDVAHGSPGNPEEYVRSEDRAREIAGDGVLVIGHTHEPWAFAVGAGTALRGDAEGTVALHADDRWVLNPGSVGQSRSRDPRARALVLDLERREATFLAVDYDLEPVRAALRAHGLPETACHRPPASLPRRLAGRAVRRLRS